MGGRLSSCLHQPFRPRFPVFQPTPLISKNVLLTTSPSEEQKGTKDIRLKKRSASSSFGNLIHMEDSNTVLLTYFDRTTQTTQARSETQSVGVCVCVDLCVWVCVCVCIGMCIDACLLNYCYVCVCISCVCVSLYVHVSVSYVCLWSREIQYVAVMDSRWYTPQTHPHRKQIRC